MGILITRPDEQGKALTEMLNKAGVAAVHLPLFSVSAGRELNDLPNKLNQLKSNDYVFAVSKNALAYAHDTLQNTGFPWRKDLHYFTVGQGSAELFCTKSELPVHYPNLQENSEGLLALPEMQASDLTDKTVLILRGNGGREYFSTEVQSRGATVEIIECYQRVPIIYENSAEQTDMFKRAGIHNILVTNAESLTYLMDFVPETEHNWLLECRLITVSQRIAQKAAQSGWRQISVSSGADNASLLNTVLMQN